MCRSGSCLLLCCLLRATASLHVPYYGTSANGFDAPARGWNSFGLQAGNQALKKGAGWDFNDYHFRQQCDLISVESGRDYYCSIDSGWSVGCNGDEYGIPTADTNVIPDMKALSNHLHAKGLKLGVYVLPGAFSSDKNKLVRGTNIRIGSLFNQSDPHFNCRQNFDFSKAGVQDWHDSVIAKFLQLGIDLIKLDYVTPGSPQAGETLPADSSGAVTAYHTAIANNNATGKMRLDISWKLERQEPYTSIWRSGAESLRLDQDVNNAGQNTLVAWKTVLRTIDAYRSFINEQTDDINIARHNKPIGFRPDMDNTYYY